MHPGKEVEVLGARRPNAAECTRAPCFGVKNTFAPKYAAGQDSGMCSFAHRSRGAEAHRCIKGPCNGAFFIYYPARSKLTMASWALHHVHALQAPAARCCQDHTGPTSHHAAKTHPCGTFPTHVPSVSRYARQARSGSAGYCGHGSETLVTRRYSNNASQSSA